MVITTLTDYGRFIEAVPEVLCLDCIIFVAGLHWALVLRSEFAAFRHWMSLGFVYFPGGDVEYFVSIGPPLANTAALSACGGAFIWIVFIEITVHLTAPLFCYVCVAFSPALGTVNLVDDEPEKQRPAITPPCDHVAIELLLIFPCLFAAEEIFGSADKTVWIISISGVAAAPNRHRNIRMEPDVPAYMYIALFAPLEKLVHSAAAIFVVSAQT